MHRRRQVLRGLTTRPNERCLPRSHEAGRHMAVFPGFFPVNSEKPGQRCDEESVNTRVRDQGRYFVAGVKEVVDGTSEAARGAASAIVGVGDGIVGGAMGAVSGALNGVARGAGLRGVVPDAAVAAAAVAAGVLGLVDWPLLALAGGTALVVRQLRGSPARATAPAADSAGRRSATTTASAPGRRATPTAKKSAAAGNAPARKRAGASTSSATGG